MVCAISTNYFRCSIFTTDLTYSYFRSIILGWPTRCPSENFQNFPNFFDTSKLAQTPSTAEVLHSGHMRIKDIPEELLERYKKREITSAQLAAATGLHPVSIRRAIKRPPIERESTSKAKLIALRQAFRASIAHLPPSEISKIAHVSISTANRIRKKYAK